MPLRTLFTTTRNWIFCSTELGAAEAAMRPADAPRERSARQARLLVETARQTAEMGEALPSGSHEAVLLSLYRDAIHWALAARANTDAPAEFPALWAEFARSGAEGSVKSLALFPASPSLDTTGDEVAQARGLAERLVWDLDAPRRHVQRIKVRRWLRAALAVLGIVLVGLGARRLVLGPNLAAGKPFRLSSTYVGCIGDPLCAALLFHTSTDPAPWVEFDLGAEYKVSRVEVANRSDCCADRAVPLVVETSTDRKTWNEVARRDEEFATWTATFPKRPARYVRLTVHKQTSFHLEGVAVRQAARARSFTIRRRGRRRGRCTCRRRL
jgi:hypothetical protein